MATIEDLLDLDVEKLEAMSDDDLLKYFSTNHIADPPIKNTLDPLDKLCPIKNRRPRTVESDKLEAKARKSSSRKKKTLAEIKAETEALAKELGI